jgi:hypothetical protein
MSPAFAVSIAVMLAFTSRSRTGLYDAAIFDG